MLKSSVMRLLVTHIKILQGNVLQQQNLKTRNKLAKQIKRNKTDPKNTTNCTKRSILDVW